MGDRSITTIRSRWDNGPWEDLAHIYCHWSGGLGFLIHEFLDGLSVVNGIGGDPPPRYVNGPGRLAIALIIHLEEAQKDPSLMSFAVDCGQERHYVIDVAFGMDGGTVNLTVYGGPMTAFGMGGEDCTDLLFSGSVEEYGAFLQKEES